MDFVPAKQPVWINSIQSLTKAFEQLETQPRIAVDTESNSLFAYQEKVCLIQISSPDADFIFDPFELHDLSLLGRLFNNPEQEKIFHASEYDLICLKRDYHFTFVNIFDTMIAARILGVSQVGLGSLLEKYFSVSLDKKYQRANWGLRPLPAEMLDYARLDTFYLFKLRDTLESELIEHGLVDLAHEDFVSACKAEGHQNGNNHAECWKVAGSNIMDSRQAAILNELCVYRDEQARKADLPHFKVISNDLLFELSKLHPSTLEEMKSVPHCSEKIIKRHGNGLLKAIARGETAPPIIRQRTPRPDEAFLARIESLKEWRKTLAKELKVESDVVLPRDLVERIASANPARMSELQSIMADAPIRYQKFGSLIMKEIKSEEKS
jgi:ribonuclease D